MNRREFLWTVALGAGACDGRRKVNEPRPARGTMDPGFAIQKWPSPLVFAGDRLVEIVASGVRVRDARTLAVTREIALRAPIGVGALAGGDFVVLLDVDRDDRAAPRLHRFAPDGGAPRRHDVAAGKPVRLLPTEVENELWMVERAGAVRSALEADGKVRLVEVIEWHGDELDTAVALTDGSLVCATSAGFSRFRPRQAATVYPSDKAVWHAAPGADADHVWITHRLEELALIRLGDPCRAERAFALSPGTPVHMHACGGLAAVLLADGANPEAVSYTVALFDADRERWRAPAPRGELRGLFIAVSPERVVVRVAPGEIHAWDAATGTKVV